MALLTSTLAGGLRPVPAHAAPSTDGLDHDVAAAWQNLETVVEQFNTAREKLRSTRVRLADADAQLAPLGQQVTELEQKVGTMAAGAYMSTGDGPVTALLGAHSPSTLLDQLTMLDHIARSHQHDLDALHAASERFQSQRRDLRALAAQQATLDRQLAVTKAAVESDLAA